MDAFQFQYLVGGAVFVIGLLYAYRQGYIGRSGTGLRNLLIMLGGLAFFMAVQGYLQYAPMRTLPEVAAPGQLRRPQVLGTPLDYGVIIAYFLGILAIGTYYGRRQKTTKDFFFAGQRFSWWLIAMSLVATTVGSYSFVKYSEVAFRYGVSSSQSYMNDWFWVPLLIFGWLPILYFSRVTSIPEYFERRFGRTARAVVTVLLLVYLVGYVGVNLYSMGKALHVLVGWPIWAAALVVALISGVYVTAGGQTSVIMTDLFQGVMLLGTGLIILFLGMHVLGGAGAFWEHLPRSHRLAFANFNEDPHFPSVGIFWQDAIANTGAFYFLNQGILMRFMSAKSVREGKKAAIFVPIVLMPLAAIAVASGGWVGSALEHAGVLPHGMHADDAFYITAEFLSRPGLFGLILAALTAALMSTIDTLITAIAAIVVNDVYRPLVRPQASERQLLRVARITSVGVTLFGFVLVPVFSAFGTIYEAHGAFTAAVTPPLVVALLFAVFWRRYTRQAVLWTLVGGSLAIIASVLAPGILGPFSFGIPATPAGPGLLGGAKVHEFTRAFFGLVVSGGLAVVVTLLTRPEPRERQRGLVWGTHAEALAAYKGSPGREIHGVQAAASVLRGDDDSTHGATGLAFALLSAPLMRALDAAPGDLVYITDQRRWLGGLRSVHAIIAPDSLDDASAAVRLGPTAYESLVASGREQRPVRVEKLYG